MGAWLIPSRPASARLPERTAAFHQSAKGYDVSPPRLTTSSGHRKFRFDPAQRFPPLPRSSRPLASPPSVPSATLVAVATALGYLTHVTFPTTTRLTALSADQNQRERERRRILRNHRFQSQAGGRQALGKVRGPAGLSLSDRVTMKLNSAEFV